MSFVIADRVKETSTSTGTGDMSLSGAITGYQSFASQCTVGDTLYYCIQGVAGSGIPSGEWECGLGTYSAANTLTRTTVTASSNANTVVGFSAGDKQVYITMPAVQVAWVRERLTAARTYYVRTDGVDTNTGLANTSGGAFLTIQKAIDVASDLDRSGFAVTIQIADGTYTGANTVNGLHGAGSFTIQGNSGTPANVIISTTSATCFLVTSPSSTVTIKDMKLQTTTSGHCLNATNTGYITYTNIVFGACAGAHVRCDNSGSASASGNYSIVGAAAWHFLSMYQSQIYCIGRTITITGTPAFSTAFAECRVCSLAYLASNTYSGAATGTRYSVVTNGVMISGATLPGSVAGSTATGGQYS